MCCSIALGVLRVFLGWNQHMATLHYAYELTLGDLEATRRKRVQECEQKTAFPVYLSHQKKADGSFLFLSLYDGLLILRNFTLFRRSITEAAAEFGGMIRRLAHTAVDYSSWCLKCRSNLSQRRPLRGDGWVWSLARAVPMCDRGTGTRVH